MSNLHLFHLINAPPGAGRVALAIATLLARWLIGLVPLAMAAAWARGDRDRRRQLLEVLATVGLALALAQIVTWLWPEPRPFVLHLGTQYLEHDADPGLPSDHVVVFWSLALAVLRTRHFAPWGFPLLALGLLVGWSRVYLGIHFPIDVIAAMPVAAAGALAARVLRRPMAPFVECVLRHNEVLADRLRGQTSRQARG